MTITKINTGLIILIVFTSLAICTSATSKKALSYSLTDHFTKMSAANSINHKDIEFVKGAFR